MWLPSPCTSPPRLQTQNPAVLQDLEDPGSVAALSSCNGPTSPTTTCSGSLEFCLKIIHGPTCFHANQTSLHHKEQNFQNGTARGGKHVRFAILLDSLGSLGALDAFL